MSNTNKHKAKCKYHRKVITEIPTDLQNMFDRSNNDLGSFRKYKKNLTDKIAEKELKTELKSDGNYYDDEIIWDKQGEFCNDYCCTVRDEEVIIKYVINYG